MLFVVAVGALSCVSAQDVNATADLAADDNVEMAKTTDISAIGNDNTQETVSSNESTVTSDESINQTQEQPATPSKIKAKIKADKVTTTYNSGKYFKIKVTDDNGGVAGVRLKLKVYTGNKYKTVYVKTGVDGVAKYKTSGLNKGTHKVVISNTNTTTVSAKLYTSSIVVNAKKLYIVGQEGPTKEGGLLVLAAYDKQNDKVIKGVKLQIKIYKNSKKYRTFNLVTGHNKKYVDDTVIIATNQFSVGKHKVTVKITSPNYKGSEKGTITIPKTAKNYKKFTYIFSNGKEKFL